MQTWVPVLNYLLATAIGALAIWRIIRWKRRSVTGEPSCPKCGYVAVGLVTARCPECGNDLAASGVVPGDGRRGRLKMRWVVVWTAVMIAMGGWTTAALRRDFLSVRQRTQSVRLTQKVLHLDVIVEARGTGIGRDAPVEEIFLRTKKSLPEGLGMVESPPDRSSAGNLVWSSRNPGSRPSQGEIEAWLRQQGFIGEGVGLQALDVLRVVDATSRLGRVEDLRYALFRVGKVGAEEWQYTAAGVVLHEFECRESGFEWSNGWLLTTLPWTILVAVVMWAAGLRWWVPRRRIFLPFCMVRADQGNEKTR